MRPRNLLITLGVVVAVLVLPNLDALQSKARQTIASAAGKAAVTNMSGVVSDNNARGLAAAELITLPIEVDEVAPGVFRASGVGNTFVITTSEGNVIFDTGLVIQASEQIRQLKAVLGDFEPVKIVLSHSHADHVGGTRLWSGKIPSSSLMRNLKKNSGTSRSSIPTCISAIAPCFLGSPRRHAPCPAWTFEG